MGAEGQKEIWNRAFTETTVFSWEEPHEWIAAILSRLGDGKGRRMLDVGSGYGRHAIAFAMKGYEVTALDISTVCLERLKGIAERENFPIALVEHDMNDHPYPFDDNSFDVVLAIQSIHHTTLSGMKETAADIKRILKPGGIVVASFPVSEKGNGSAHEVLEPRTLVPLDGPECGVPHHYVDEAEIREIFADFDVDCIALDPGNHWFVEAQA